MNAWLHGVNASAAPLLLDHVWPMLWQSSLLIVLVALAGRTLFRKASPQLRYALWGLVLIRLVVPPWVDLPTALGHWGMPEMRQHVAAYVPLDAAAPAASAMLQRPLVGGVSPALSNGVTDGGAQVLSDVASSIQWSLALLVFALWALGVASLLLLLLARLFRMHRDVKHGAPAPAWIGEAVARYRTTLSVRLPVRVRVVPGNQSPALMGLFRPTILLPQGALENLREDQLRAVLAHEIAHVKRWDFVVNWAQVLLGIAYFFHPLLWFANREMRRERELACDDLTLITLGLNREGYAESLLRVAEGLSTVRRLAPVQVGVMEGELELARRLRRILDQTIRPAPRLTALSLAIVVAFAAMFGTWRQTTAENKSEAAVPAEEVETRVLEVKVVDEAGQPLEGSDVSLVFVRTGVDWGSTPGLLPGFGKPDSVKTNTAGMAAVRYPRYVVEKIETASVALKAGHVEYVSGVQVELNVNEPSPIIVLDRGATVRVSGYLGERENTVSPLFAKLSGTPAANWQLGEHGVLERRGLWATPHYLLLIHPDQDGTLYFTDYLRFNPTQGMTDEFSLPLRKGVQLAGKVSETVARPVKNGWVEVRILPVWEVDSLTYNGGNLEWTAHSAINEDGSFAIEGLPRGRGRITAACDGAVSMGEPGPHGLGTHIVTMLDRESNDVEVTMIPTATAVVRITGPDGKPVARAKVIFAPYVWDKDQYFDILGKAKFSSAEAIQMPLEETVPDWDGMIEKFSGASDVNGIATIENLPPWVPRFSVASDDFELSPDETGGRRRSIELRPGETTEVAVELVAKEADLPMAYAPVASAAPTDREKANASSPVAPAEPETDQSEAAAPADEVEMKTLEVKVVGEDGKPLEGVELEVHALRPAVSPGSSYMWGPITGKPKHQTNVEGTASVRYPRYVREKMETGVVGLRAKLHGFATMPSIELNADGTSPPIVMAVAASVRMSAYIGSEENPVSPIIARFGGPDGYNGEVNGEVAIERRDLREGLYWIWLGHVDNDGTKYFSEAVQFEAAKGEFRGYALPLRKGVKLTGRLDDTVPRPVRNGWIEAHVFPPEAGDLTVGNPRYVEWSAHAPVRDDGTFELDGLPLGYAAVTAGCDGAISTGERRPGYDALGFPILVSLSEPSTDVELAMAATATTVIRAIGPKGEPVAGALIDFWPSMNYLFRYTTVIRNPLLPFGESQAREYTGVTDDAGIARIENLPPWVPEFFVTSDGYELPKASEEQRKQSIELHPGKTTEVTAQLVPKGTDFLGAGTAATPAEEPAAALEE